MSRVKFLGISVNCPESGVVTIPRSRFSIGPKRDWPKMNYMFKCDCGKLHKIPTTVADKTTKKLLGR